MFFHHKLHTPSSQIPLHFSESTVIHWDNCPFPHIFTQPFPDNPEGIFCHTLSFCLGIPNEILEIIGDHRVKNKELWKDEYAMVLGDDSVIYASGEQGLFYGYMTLRQMLEENACTPGFLYDAPTCAIRGYRCYLPSRDLFDDFRQIVDMLAYYKYNTIILEVGGAMEYRRHPEVNEAWKIFCKDVHRYSGRSMEIQNGYPWDKNSIHADNGGGDILTQDECRMLADYCRSRGLEVIPECPTLSHSDYMVLAHPELREREEDPYPDTYCPLHPDTYSLVFDILDEVVEVFQPGMINIGHDELYTMGLCPRCRNRDPVELFIGDVTKIRNHLAKQGVSICMWGEKLLKAQGSDGWKCGGWSDPKEKFGITYNWPQLYPCADRMPDGVTFLHWYWNDYFGEELDKVYHEHGYPVVFSNFSALGYREYFGCTHFRQRLEQGIQGAFVSNWGSQEYEYMQRNFQIFDLIGTAYALWCDDYDTDRERQPYFISRTMEEAFRRRLHMIKHPIRISHLTEAYVGYKYFYDGIFIEDEIYLLGHYRLIYGDGTVAELPVRYGTHITTSLIDDPVTSPSFQEMCGGALPVHLSDGRLGWETVYENPHPDKRITGICYVPAAGKEDELVSLLKADFGCPTTGSCEKKEREVYSMTPTLLGR